MVQNKWLTPLQRSFAQIKTNLLSKLRSNNPEITDFSEGNIFIILISMFSAIAEVLHYYIDNTARETFFTTARRYSSLIKHAKLVDYHIRSAIPASMDVVLFVKEGYTLIKDLTLDPSQNEQYTFTENNRTWILSKTVVWEAVQDPETRSINYNLILPFVQKSHVNKQTVGTISVPSGKNISMTFDNLIPSGQYYAEGSAVITINGNLWRLVDTFAYSSAKDQVCKIEVNSNGIPFILFGDGINGAIPADGATVEIEFDSTYGAEGNIEANSVDINTISSVFNSVSLDDYFASINTDTETQTLSAGVTISEVAFAKQFYAAAGGSNYEDFSMLKDHVPLSVKTLGVIITKEDYEAKAKLINGVNKAYVDYKCGQFLTVYITPDNGDVASTDLINNVLATLQSSKVITTNVSVRSTTESLIYLDATVTGRKSYTTNNIVTQIKNALINAYGYNTSDIYKVIRVSDIYALIDNLSMVDYLTINKLYMVPPASIIGFEVSSNNTDDNVDLEAPLNFTKFELHSYTINDSEEEYVQYKIEIADTNKDKGLGKIYRVTDDGDQLVGDNITLWVTDGPYTININKDNNQLGDSKGYSNVTDNTTKTVTVVEEDEKEVPLNKVSLSFMIDYEQDGEVFLHAGVVYKLYLQPMNRDQVPYDYSIPIFKSENITLHINEVI